ncbi:MAG: TolC family protein [Saprospiraceae bacterium]|nr:TolC family protein [Saprospiraceae bacterium]
MMHKIVFNSFPILCFIILFHFPVFVQSQDEIALRMLELEVLEANNNRKIISIDKKITENNYNKGLAGLIPTANFTLRDNVTYATNFNRTADGREIVNDFTVNNTANANINAEFVIYNGGRNKNLYERLKLFTTTASLDEQRVLENLIYNTRLLYYQVVRQKQLINTTVAALDFTNQRLQLAVNKLDIGTGNKVVVLQTELEKNQLLAELESQNQILKNLFNQLNALRQKPLDTPLGIADTSYVVSNLDKSQLYSALKKNNVDFATAENNIQLALNAQRDINGLRKPQITTNLGYTFNRADNGGGFFLLNQTNGLAGGIVLTMPIYDANRIKIQTKNAALITEQSKYQKELIEINLESTFEQLYLALETSERLSRLQENNVAIAKENIMIGLNRFKVGVTDGFELEQILQGYLQANFRLIDALYQIKINELELLRLTGTLIQK